MTILVSIYRHYVLDYNHYGCKKSIVFDSEATVHCCRCTPNTLNPPPPPVTCATRIRISYSVSNVRTFRYILILKHTPIVRTRRARRSARPAVSHVVGSHMLLTYAMPHIIAGALAPCAKAAAHARASRYPRTRASAPERSSVARATTPSNKSRFSSVAFSCQRNLLRFARTSPAPSPPVLHLTSHRVPRASRVRFPPRSCVCRANHHRILASLAHLSCLSLLSCCQSNRVSVCCACFSLCFFSAETETRGAERCVSFIPSDT